MRLTFIFLSLFLSGCANFVNSVAEAERRQQEMHRQCASSGGVVYNGTCMTQAQAQIQQQADQQQRNRQTQLQTSCIQSGGTWAGYTCIGNSNPAPILIVPRY